MAAYQLYLARSFRHITFIFDPIQEQAGVIKVHDLLFLSAIALKGE